MHGRVRAVVGVLAAAVAILALSVGPAWATTGHTFNTTFGTPGSQDPGGFGGSPGGIAVDQTSGDVFVADPGHTDSGGASAPRVNRYDGAGAPVSDISVDPVAYNNPQGVAVDSANSLVYVSASSNADGTGAVIQYSLAGASQGTLTPDTDTTFNGSGPIAVDPANGDVYVAATDSLTFMPIVEVFGSDRSFKGRFDGSSGNDSALGGIGAIAVDSGGNVYIVDSGKNRLDRFDTAGAFQATVLDANPIGIGFNGLAVDPVSDELYVAENSNQVEVFSAGAAAHQDLFGLGAGISGLAVNAGNDTVYASDPGQGTGVIATTFAGPTVATTGTSAVDANNATLEGTVDPEGNPVDYRFDWGLDRNYGNSTSGGPVASAGSFSDQIGGLTPATTYHFRIVGSNSDGSGSINGNDRTFTTDAAAPIIENTPSFASQIQPDAATLNGTVNPQGSDTQWYFEYGTSTSYGTSTTPNQTGAGIQGDQPVSAPLAGLTPGTLYHYRLVATNVAGGSPGPDHTFMTAPAQAAGASSVTGISAALTGVVNPQGHATTYHFEYGETAPAYGSTTPERSAGSGNGNTTVTASIEKLKPGTTYHVRVIATDTTTGVTTTGVDGTFTTNPAPSAATGAVTGVTTDGATFSGTADTHGLGGSYTFYVASTNSPFVTKTDAVTIPAGGAAGGVSASLKGLQPGQTYTVRLGVDSSLVTTVGDAVTFTTAPLPPVNPPAPPPTVSNPYGCANPVLSAYNNHPKPGDRITVSGSDLGVGGTIALGNETITPDGWNATSFTFVIPDDATGSLPLTINCGKVSNTVAVQMYQAPSNTFATPKGKVKGSSVSVTLKVPGPGDITVKGAGLKTAKKHVGKAGTYTVKATLSASGKKSLKRHKRLARTLSVSFKPNGGTAATKKVKVTFKR